jgi:hypothetical protein
MNVYAAMAAWKSARLATRVPDADVATANTVAAGTIGPGTAQAENATLTKRKPTGDGRRASSMSLYLLVAQSDYTYRFVIIPL